MGGAPAEGTIPMSACAHTEPRRAEGIGRRSEIPFTWRKGRGDNHCVTFASVMRKTLANEN